MAPSLFQQKILLFSSADLEDLGAAFGAQALNRGLTILHGDLLGIFNLTLFLALYAVTLHRLFS
jgi:hypothetical protein